MKKQSHLVALAINDEQILRAVRNRLQRYFEDCNKDLLVDVVGSTFRFEMIEGIEQLVDYAFTLAETARVNNGAKIGLSGSWGIVTVRVDERWALKFQTLIVVATCAQGLVAIMVGTGTFPEEIYRQYQAALVKVVAPLYPISVDETFKELHEIGHVAAASWAELEFDDNCPSVRFLLN